MGRECHECVGGAGLLSPPRVAALEEGRRATGAAEALRVSGGEGRSLVLVLLTIAPTRPPPLLRLLASPRLLPPPPSLPLLAYGGWGSTAGARRDTGGCAALAAGAVGGRTLATRADAVALQPSAGLLSTGCRREKLECGCRVRSAHSSGSDGAYLHHVWFVGSR